MEASGSDFDKLPRGKRMVKLALAKATAMLTAERDSDSDFDISGTQARYIIDYRERIMWLFFFR